MSFARKKSSVACWQYLVIISFVVVSLRAVDADDSFGKTHFILGYTPEQQVARFPAAKQSTQVAPKSSHVQVLFSPDHNIPQTLIDLINQEQESIKIAIYMFTDKEIAQALVQAQARGVRVEVVADQAALADKWGRLPQLQEGGISIAVYKGPTNNPNQSNIMHNKFAIFEHNRGAQSIVWTGSFNFTKSAKLHNQENVMIVADMQVAADYLRQFEVIKKRCTVTMKPSRPRASVKMASKKRASSKKSRTKIV